MADKILLLPESEFDFQYSRSSGPGGQNVNKVNSRAQLSWNIFETTFLTEDRRNRFIFLFKKRIRTDGVLILTSDRFRDQERNRQDCIDKLEQMVTEIWTAPTPRKPTRRTKSSVKNRLKEKRIASEKKRMRARPRVDD